MPVCVNCHYTLLVYSIECMHTTQAANESPSNSSTATGVIVGVIVALLVVLVLVVIGVWYMRRQHQRNTLV